MKTWIILGAVLVLVIGATIFVSADVFSNDQEETKTTSTTCTSGNCPYANSGGCTAESNCGLSGCSAGQGTGSCGCGR